MNRPVFVGLLAVAVVAAAGLGALDVGTDAGSGSSGGESSVAGATSEPTVTEASAGTTPAAGEGKPETSHSKTGNSASKPSSSGDSPHAAVVRYPPGTSPIGIDEPRTLLRAHTTSLSATGFVVRSRANATVLETGMRIDGTTRGGARVAPGAREYYAYRTDAAGPLQRRSEGWYDGSVERYRKVGEFGSVDESTREARSAGELAGRPLLAPHLRGGAFERTRVRRADGKKRFVFAASAVSEKRIVVEGLPEATTDIRSYEARVVVDSGGRIRSFSATVEYVIGGESETHHLDYDLAQVGNATVERPEWATETTTEGASARGASRSERTQRGR